MPIQWAEKHKCLFWSRSTGVLFRGSRLVSAPSCRCLGCIWPPSRPVLPSSLWDTRAENVASHHTGSTTLSHAPAHIHSPAHTHSCSQTLHQSCPTSPATATLCPPLPFSPVVAPSGPCHSHGSEWEGRCHCQCPPKASVAVLASRMDKALPVPSGPVQPRPPLLAFPLSLLSMREDLCLYSSPCWVCFMCLISSRGEAA